MSRSKPLKSTDFYKLYKISTVQEFGRHKGISPGMRSHLGSIADNILKRLKKEKYCTTARIVQNHSDEVKDIRTWDINVHLYNLGLEGKINFWKGEGTPGRSSFAVTLAKK